MRFLSFLFLACTLLSSCSIWDDQVSSRIPASVKDSPRQSCLNLGGKLISSETLTRKKIQKLVKKKYGIRREELDDFYNQIRPSKTRESEHPFAGILEKTPRNQRYVATGILAILVKRKPHHGLKQIRRDYAKLTRMCNL